MIGRGPTLCLALLCALLLGAIGASSASAEGTTAYTCEPVTEKAQWSDEHCLQETSGGKGFRHTKIENEKTFVEFSNDFTANATTEPTPAVFKGRLAGGSISIHVTCAKVLGAGLLTNETGPPMKVSGSSLNVSYSECVVKEPAKCKIGNITVALATATTKTNSMELEFTPQKGEPLATFSIAGCENKALDGEYEITGTAKAIPEGATLNFTEASTKGLKIAGHEATLVAKETLYMTSGNPIAFTTTETP